MFLCGLILVADTERHNLQNFICVNYFLLLGSYKSIKIVLDGTCITKRKFKLIFHNAYLIENDDLQNYFHFTNKEKLSITARIPILSKVNAQTDVTNNTLFVSDSKTSQAISDEITASMGVKTTNTSAQSALSSNSNFMIKILEALKATSVQENETRYCYI